MKNATVIGGGLAGCEAAWYLANEGIKVDLYEMRPVKNTPAHYTDMLAELVCSNSLRSGEITNAAGLLKEEMRRLKSIIIEAADATKVPAGGALAVDRNAFARRITSAVSEHPNITLHRKEITQIPNSPAIIATGPLTSDGLASALKDLLGDEHLYFYDAAAPIVMSESIDWEKAFWGSRYGKGEDDYANLPMTREEYLVFHHELINAERHSPQEFEEPIFFEGCMPLEIMARRGDKTILFGPLKPVGLVDPQTGKEPYAVVQLRKENLEGTLLNIVGFQTSLKWGEQKRVFSLIPGLKAAEYVRFGFIHRNTFISSPRFLNSGLEFKKIPGLFFTGQITGVEGYIESAASGIVAGINLKRFMTGRQLLELPGETVIGALCHHITHSSGDNFQPMKANFGILPPLTTRIRSKKERNLALSQRSLAALDLILPVN